MPSGLDPHKKEGPTQVIVFLGVEIDTREDHMCFRLPVEKVVMLRDQLDREVLAAPLFSLHRSG